MPDIKQLVCKECGEVWESSSGFEYCLNCLCLGTDVSDWDEEKEKALFEGERSIQCPVCKSWFIGIDYTSILIGKMCPNCFNPIDIKEEIEMAIEKRMKFEDLKTEKECRELAELLSEIVPVYHNHYIFVSHYMRLTHLIWKFLQESIMGVLQNQRNDNSEKAKWFIDFFSQYREPSVLQKKTNKI